MSSTSLRSRYVGAAAAAASAPSAAAAAAPKKPLKHAEKLAKLFQMHWDPSEDTSVDVNPLYAARAAPSVMHGRRIVDAEDRKPLSERPSGAAPPGSAGHWSSKPLASMTERDWRIMREDFDIHVRGGKPLNPLRSWNEAAIPASLRSAIDAMGYTAPTPIQRQTLPMGLGGRDLIGIAETGSGKTAAFLIPLLAYVLAQPDAARAGIAEAGPLALVMAPTRELAQQIEEEAVKLAKFSGLVSCCVTGGNDMEAQGVRLRRGVHVVIGTPGRLIDMLESRFLVLHQCKYIVLDEADRMIDMGFEPQVTAVMDAMASSAKPEVAEGEEEAPPPVTTITTPGVYRTTHMFSATFPTEVQKLARSFLRSPATVQIGDVDTGKNKRITQVVSWVGTEARKKTRLYELLSTSPLPLIVFVNAKKACDVLARDLEARGFEAVVLHGGKTQDIREDSLAAFKAGEVGILLATDVAGRGLDIPNVAHVINYDMPGEIDKYTHRIGRTGRAGKTGLATTLLTEADAPILPALVAHLEATQNVVPPELAQQVAKTRDKAR